MLAKDLISGEWVGRPHWTEHIFIYMYNIHILYVYNVYIILIYIYMQASQDIVWSSEHPC